jgi:hypothetical protein
VSDLLTVDDIAKLWKVSRDYAMRYLVKRPEFPEPAPGSTRKSRRWKAEDVQRFLSQSPTENPT